MTALTVFAVDFDGVGGELQCGSTLVGLRKPEIVHLPIGAQHIDIQH